MEPSVERVLRTTVPVADAPRHADRRGGPGRRCRSRPAGPSRCTRMCRSARRSARSARFTGCRSTRRRPGATSRRCATSCACTTAPASRSPACTSAAARRPAPRASWSRRSRWRASCSACAEISVETSPMDLRPDVIDQLVDVGVRRLSVGRAELRRPAARAMERYDTYGSSAEIIERLDAAAGCVPHLQRGPHVQPARPGRGVDRARPRRAARPRGRTRSRSTR